MLICSFLSNADSSSPVISESAVDDVVSELVSRVGDYSRSNPDAPGAILSWVDNEISVGEVILIHSYPSYQPSYFYVVLVNAHEEQTSFVTIGALDGNVQAYGDIYEGYSYPSVDHEMAIEIASRLLGRHCEPEELIAVSMPNKSIYWYVTYTGDFFINLNDPNEIHYQLDSSLIPPPIELEIPDEAEKYFEDTHQDSFDFPPSYDLTVPHYYQFTSYHCGPTSCRMIFDYWGEDISDSDIGKVANCLEFIGSYASDNRRAGSFSYISTAIQEPSLHGYNERDLGYSSVDNFWSYPNTSDPDYPDRYNDLKELVSSGYPIQVLTWYDASHSAGHFRVVKGYDDKTDIFIVHDPWYTAPYQGPDVNFDQTFFVDDLWEDYYHWGSMMAPFIIDITCPATVQQGEQFSFTVDIECPGPHPFDGSYPMSEESCTVVIPSDFSFATGETAAKSISLASSGSSTFESWTVIAGTTTGSASISASAKGKISGTSYSYSSYEDFIGGGGDTSLVVNTTGIENGEASDIFQLFPIAPNPAHGGFTIDFAVHEMSNVEINVFDLAGRHILRSTDSECPEGIHSVYINDLSSGLYFCSMSAGEYQDMKKVVVIK